jgi:origin recognition complex subunit 2
MLSSDNWTAFELSEDDGSGSEDIDDAQDLLRVSTIPTTEEKGHNSAFLRTTFDSYFLHFAKPTKTGPAVFSSQVPPLSTEEYLSAIKSASSSHHQLTDRLSVSLQNLFPAHFSRFCLELDEGFNLIFYGFGSKRALLNQFATQVCSKRGHVVVVNGSQPKSSLKDLFSTIEMIPDLQAVPLLTDSTESQIRRICEFFAPLNERPPLYIFIHNIDSPVFRNAKAKSCLSALGSCPRIHLVASVDHVNAPLLWSSSEASTRSREDAGFSTSLPMRGFSWLWHDLTTFASYDHELAHVDKSSFAGASLQQGGRRRRDLQVASVLGGGGAPMTETAAQHILASVTQKAKRLFVLIATKQLAMMDADEDAVSGDFQRVSLAYDTLFTSARDNFIATNDTALKSLLGEFKDHNLVVSSGSGMGEILWIPLRRERLEKVIKALQID